MALDIPAARALARCSLRGNDWRMTEMSPAMAAQSPDGLFGPVLETTAGGVLREAAGRAAGMAALVEGTAYCHARLAAHKTPRHWVFTDAFPLTGSGKVQKFLLREQFSSGQARSLPAAT